MSYIGGTYVPEAFPSIGYSPTPPAPDPVWPTPAPAPAATPVTVASPTTDMLTQLYNELLAQGPQPVTTVQNVDQNTVQTQKQNPSAELEQQMNDYMNQLNALSSGMTDAYGGVQNEYTNLIKAVSDAYGLKASDVAAQQQGAALGSGLTPLEAASLGSEANLDVLRQMFPQVAALSAERAQVPVDLQTALAELQRGNYLPFLQGIVAPYQMGVAGQVTNQTTKGTTTTNTTDPNAYTQQLMGVASMMMDDYQFQQTFGFEKEKFYATLAQDDQQFQQQMDMYEAKAANATSVQEYEAAMQMQMALINAQLASAQSVQDFNEALALQENKANLDTAQYGDEPVEGI